MHYWFKRCYMLVAAPTGLGSENGVANREQHPIGSGIQTHTCFLFIIVRNSPDSVLITCDAFPCATGIGYPIQMYTCSLGRPVYLISHLCNRPDPRPSWPSMPSKAALKGFSVSYAPAGPRAPGMNLKKMTCVFNFPSPSLLCSPSLSAG